MKTFVPKPKTAKNKKPKILVILGPTAAGKSDLGVRLAKRLNGEIVSADSRQVYRGLDIGSGKITKKEMKGVRHHLLDVADPRKVFTVARFQTLAYEAIDGILARGKLPVIAGGTGFYIQSIVDGLILPETPVNVKLRRTLGTYSTAKLGKTLGKLDPKRFASIDPHNRVRLIRAIEIAKALGAVPRMIKDPKYRSVQIGIDLPDPELKGRISLRLKKRLKAGMIREVRTLLAGKNIKGKGGGRPLSHRRLQELGLEYRYISLFLQGKLSRMELERELETRIRQFAKRQRRWFRKDARVKWYEPTEYRKMLKVLGWGLRPEVLSNIDYNLYK